MVDSRPSPLLASSAVATFTDSPTIQWLPQNNVTTNYVSVASALSDVTN